MPKAKPVSLWPLSFEEAITAIIRVDPHKVGLGQQQTKKTRKSTKNHKPITT